LLYRSLLLLCFIGFSAGCSTTTAANDPENLTYSEKPYILSEVATFSNTITKELIPENIKLVERLPFYEMTDERIYYAVGNNHYWYVLKADMLYVISKELDESHQLLGSVYIPGLRKGLGQRYSMELYKDYLYICIGRVEISVVSVANPSNPHLLDQFGSFKNLGAISVVNDLLFVTDTKIMNVYSLVAPETPNLISKHDFGGWAYNVSYGNDVYYISSNSSTVCFNFTSDMKVRILEILTSKWNQCSHIIDGNRVILLDADGVRLYEYSESTRSHNLLGYAAADASYADSIILTNSFLYFVTSSRYLTTRSRHYAVDLSNPDSINVSALKVLPGKRFFVGEDNELLIADDRHPRFVNISDDGDISFDDTVRLPGEIDGVAVLGNNLFALGSQLYSISLLNSAEPGVELPFAAEIPWYWGYSYFGNIWAGFDNHFSIGKKLLIWEIENSSNLRSYKLHFDKKANVHSSFVYEDFILFTSAHKNKPGMFMVPIQSVLQLKDQAELTRITDEPTWDVAIQNGNVFSIVKTNIGFEIVVSHVENNEWEYGIQRISIPKDSYHLKCMEDYVIVENCNSLSGVGLDSLVFRIQQDGHLNPINFKIPNGFVFGLFKGYLYISKGDGFYVIDIDNPLHRISEIYVGFGINRFTFYNNRILVSTDGGVFIYE